MADSVTEVTQTGWFSRIGNAFKGILFGLILLLGGIGLLWWNEGRAVYRAQDLNEGVASVVSVQNAPVLPENEGKLVHMTGTASTDDVLKDEMFGMEQHALRLKRVVEVYQWEEKSSSKEEKNLGGSTKTTTTYTYDKKWAEGIIDSSKFHEKAGHTNPGHVAFESEEWMASSITLGAFQMTPTLVRAINTWKTLPVASEIVTAKKTAMPQLQLDGDGLFIGENKMSPNVGDLRIRFKFVAPCEVSLFAKQRGDTFEPYLTSRGGELLRLQVGNVSAANMFQAAQDENTTLAWILRALGTFIIFIGFTLIFKPLSVLADLIPFVGSLVEVGTSLVALLLTLPIALTTIAMAWVFYRPLIGIPLLAVAVAGIFLLAKKIMAARARPEYDGTK